MYEGIRIFWNLAAIGGAIAVGLLTHDAGLIAVTFFGGLFVPRLLGLAPRGRRGFGPFAWGHRGCAGGGRSRDDRFRAWHGEVHREAGSAPQPGATPAQV